MITNQQTSGNEKPKKSFGDCIKETGSKMHVIWKVNHPAHLIS